jgi:hypothetical protein
MIISNKIVIVAFLIDDPKSYRGEDCIDIMRHLQFTSIHSFFNLFRHLIGIERYLMRILSIFKGLNLIQHNWSYRQSQVRLVSFL